MTAYTIKPLAWKQNRTEWFAETPFGVFSIFKSCFREAFKARFNADCIGFDHCSINDAKAACTEHWESLLKQALEEV